MGQAISKKQIANLLKDKRLECGFTGVEVVQRLKQQYDIELSDKTLYGYERAVSSPSIPIFLALCRIYEVEDVAGALEGAKPRRRSLTGAEEKLVEYFRQASPEAQDLALKMLKPSEAPHKNLTYIRHYLVPAAAGYASPIEGEDFEEIPLPDGAPASADFCITIRGDSMEPYIKDGELAYVKQGAPLEEFEAGVFFVDGDVFCKQWCPGYSGETYLLSANPARQDANITITRDSGRNCVYFGKVLLHHRLPPPKYM